LIYINNFVPGGERAHVLAGMYLIAIDLSCRKHLAGRHFDLFPPTRPGSFKDCIGDGDPMYLWLPTIR